MMLVVSKASAYKLNYLQKSFSIFMLNKGKWNIYGKGRLKQLRNHFCLNSHCEKIKNTENCRTLTLTEKFEDSN